MSAQVARRAARDVVGLQVRPRRAHRAGLIAAGAVEAAAGARPAWRRSRGRAATGESRAAASSCAHPIRRYGAPRAAWRSRPCRRRRPSGRRPCARRSRRPGSRPRPRSWPASRDDHLAGPSGGEHVEHLHVRGQQQRGRSAATPDLPRALGEQLAERRAEPAALPARRPPSIAASATSDPRRARTNRADADRRSRVRVDREQRLVVGVVDLGQVAQLRLGAAHRPRS